MRAAAKIRGVFYIFLSLLALFMSLNTFHFFYSNLSASKDINLKIKSIKLHSMPDLSISTESYFIRNRTFFNSGDDYFREFPFRVIYFPSAFIIGGQ